MSLTACGTVPSRPSRRPLLGVLADPALADREVDDVRRVAGGEGVVEVVLERALVVLPVDLDARIRRLEAGDRVLDVPVERRRQEERPERDLGVRLDVRDDRLGRDPARAASGVAGRGRRRGLGRRSMAAAVGGAGSVRRRRGRSAPCVAAAHRRPMTSATQRGQGDQLASVHAPPSLLLWLPRSVAWWLAGPAVMGGLLASSGRAGHRVIRRVTHLLPAAVAASRPGRRPCWAMATAPQAPASASGGQQIPRCPAGSSSPAVGEAARRRRARGGSGRMNGVAGMGDPAADARRARRRRP